MRRTICNDVHVERTFTAMHIDPAPLRPHAEDALRCPSRYGDRLHYRSGLVTDLAGRVIKIFKGKKA